MEYLKFEDNEGIGVLTLNRPDKLNSFNTGYLAELDSFLDTVSCRVLVITGAGRAFCAGGDIQWEKEIGELSAKETKLVMGDLQKLLLRLENLPIPVIAAVNGHAVGGGSELAMACDIRIASKSAKFIHPETNLGVVAPLGGTQRLPRLVGLGRAKLMLYTGMVVDADQAFEWGLVDMVADDCVALALNIAKQIVDKPAKALELTKKVINKNYSQDLVDKDELDYYVHCSKTDENKNRLNAFLSKKQR
ncbi:MAG: enoyl-CoA hydratase/isomerase family protein [Nanoarchaeota archaeon]|nr:enoyl-CoA hydratase/isomerase family protein [Nanoarchaeota archaeon]MBU1704700.1 enoyl-CoA hydratase/isomerase family protein [Nanoarchaeota archaeon]